MIRILTTTTVILLYHLTFVSSEIPKCCDGDNILVEGQKCIDGKQPKKLSCSLKLTMENGSDIIFDDKDNLKFDGDDTVIPPDKYCGVTIQQRNTYEFIICYESMAADDSSEGYRALNLILTIISIIFIILTILTYVLLVPELLDLQGICLLQSIAGIGFSFIAFGIINMPGYLERVKCEVLAYLMYISFMYAFFWLNISCFHMWRMIVKPNILRRVTRWTLIYHTIGILGPVCMLLFVLTVTYSGSTYFESIHPGIGENKCWFRSQITTLIYFYGPISVLLCINIMYFIWTTYVLWGQMKQCTDKKAKILKYRLRLCLKLFFVMGIPWCFEVISAVLENYTAKWIWVIPDALNALQGLLIFLIMVIFRKKVIRALASKKIFRSVRLPASWKHAQDDECDELEEELSLSGVEEKKADVQSAP